MKLLSPWSTNKGLCLITEIETGEVIIKDKPKISFRISWTQLCPREDFIFVPKKDDFTEFLILRVTNLKSFVIN